MVSISFAFMTLAILFLFMYLLCKFEYKNTKINYLLARSHRNFGKYFLVSSQLSKKIICQFSFTQLVNDIKNKIKPDLVILFSIWTMGFVIIELNSTGKWRPKNEEAPH